MSILPDYEVTSASFHSGIYVVFRKEAKSNPKIKVWIDFMVAKHQVEDDPG